MALKEVLQEILLLFIMVGLSIFFGLESLIRSLLPRSFFRKDIKGEVVLITGGGSGIGRCVATKLAAKGAKIVSWDINETGNSETAKLIQKDGGKCFPYSVDICNREEVYRMAKRVKKEVGKVDILINNAGVVTGRRILESPDEKILQTFNVNVISHFWTIKAFLPDMKKDSSGHIVTIASLAGIFGVSKLVDYCSSKFAAVGLDESLRVELNSDGYSGIKTTVVCPHFINTGMFQGAGQSEIFQRIVMTPDFVGEEIVEAILMSKKCLYLPHKMTTQVALKGLIPLKAGKILGSLIKVDSFMDGFVGRGKSE